MLLCLQQLEMSGRHGALGHRIQLQLVLQTAERFAKSFEREGVNLWRDSSIRSGEAFDAVIENALKPIMFELTHTAALAVVMCVAAGCSHSHPSRTAHEVAASADSSSDEVDHFPPCDKLSVADLQPFFNTSIKKIADPPSSTPA